MPKRRAKQHNQKPKKRNLFDTLPQDAMNEIASYLTYKQLTKLRVSKQMNALIEETPAGKKARSANILEDEIKKFDQINQYGDFIISCSLSSSIYINSAALVYYALNSAKLISLPELSISNYLIYNVLDASIGAIFATGFGRILPNYHLHKGCSNMATMAMGAFSTCSGLQGGLLGIKTAEIVSHIAHLPEQLQYAGANLGYVIGLGLGEYIAANLGFYALTKQYGFSLFKKGFSISKHPSELNSLHREVQMIRRELSARRMWGYKFQGR